MLNGHDERPKMRSLIDDYRQIGYAVESAASHFRLRQVIVG
jgi:hypothetical protein